MDHITKMDHLGGFVLFSSLFFRSYSFEIFSRFDFVDSDFLYIFFQMQSYFVVCLNICKHIYVANLIN